MGILEKEPFGLNEIMEQMPKNSILDPVGNCETREKDTDHTNSEPHNGNGRGESKVQTKIETQTNETKIQLSFSVDRLLNSGTKEAATRENCIDMKCCENLQYSCCSHPNCMADTDNQQQPHPSVHHQPHFNERNDVFNHLYESGIASISDCKSVVRPTPIRAMGGRSEAVGLCTPYSPLTTSALLRFHSQHQRKQSLTVPSTLSNSHTHAMFSLSPLLSPLSGLKVFPMTSSIEAPSISSKRFSAKASSFTDIPSASSSSSLSQHQHQQQQQQQMAAGSGGFMASGGNNALGKANSGNSGSSGNIMNNGKRKRSWSRAVFSNLQRKGLEIQFQQQKYITKPDRRKLAARLNLTDAQVKVWFQNRRMKWRHTRENLKSGQEKQVNVASGNQSTTTTTGGEKGSVAAIAGSVSVAADASRTEFGYSSNSTSSAELSENEGEEDEIDVVE